MSRGLRITLALVIALLSAGGLGLLAGCGDDESGGTKPVTLTGTCSGCHEDEAKLQATALPDPSPQDGDTGEG